MSQLIKYIGLVLESLQLKYKNVDILISANQQCYDQHGWPHNFETTDNLIACLNVNQNHWVTLTNIEVQRNVSPSEITINKPVDLYDSLNDNRYLQFLKPLLSSMIKERNSFHVYKVHAFYP